MARNQLMFAMPGAAAVAVQIDVWQKGQMYPGVSIEATERRRGRGWEYVITCSAEAARLLLDECESRATGGHYMRGRGGEGWDQPQSWGRACRIAAERIRAALTIHEGED